MNAFQYRVFVLLLTVSFVLPIEQAMAQGRGENNNRPVAAAGAVSLPISGTVLNGATPIGQFGGTVTINRFAREGNQIVAVGIVRGTVINLAGQVVKSGMQTVVLPVTNIGRLSAINMVTPGTAQPRVVPAFLTDPKTGRITLAQAQQTCGVLHLDLGASAINLLGFNVSLSPVTLDISGDSAGPLGALVCQVLDLLGNVAGVVGILNQLLGLVTGLLGGLTGGLGG